jgi:hypothetical protein
MLEAVSRNADLVIGRIDGAREHANAHELGKSAWPILRDHLKSRRREVVDELREAFHAGKAVTGIDDVWPTGRKSAAICSSSRRIIAPHRREKRTEDSARPASAPGPK